MNIFTRNKSYSIIIVSDNIQQFFLDYSQIFVNICYSEIIDIFLTMLYNELVK